MKLNKSYILTALGVLGSPLLTINANADTIYMCKACKSGTYANNGKCETCPAGSYCIDGVKYTCAAGKYSTAGASSCSTCSDGTYSTAGASSCTTCEAGNYCTGGKKYACSDGTYSDANASSCKTCSTAGKYCSGGRQYSCPAGYYCPDGKSTKSCETRYYYGGCAVGDKKYKWETKTLEYSLKGATSSTKIKASYTETYGAVWDYFYTVGAKDVLSDKCSGQPYCLYCDPVSGAVTLKKNTNSCN